MGTEQLRVFYLLIFNTKTKQFLFLFQQSHPSISQPPLSFLQLSHVPVYHRMTESMLLATSSSPKSKIYLCALGDCRRVCYTHTYSFPACFFLFFCRCHAFRSRINPKRLLLALQLDYSLIVLLFPPATKNEKKREEKKKEKSREEGFLTSTSLPGFH